MTNNSNRSVVPEAREALNKFKYEVLVYNRYVTH